MSDDSFRHRVQDAWCTACLICERSPSEWISTDNRRLVNSLHHINGDDTDDRVANVISLCQRCHIHVHKTDAPPYRQWHRQLPIEHRHAWNSYHKTYYEGPQENSPQAEWFFGDEEGTPESARSHDQQSMSPDGFGETADPERTESVVDEGSDDATSDQVRCGVDPDIDPGTVSVEYTPSNGDRRRVRFVDRDDGPGWWHLRKRGPANGGGQSGTNSSRRLISRRTELVYPLTVDILPAPQRQGPDSQNPFAGS